MSTAIPRKQRFAEQGLSFLQNGDCMKQPEFHRLYEQCPEDRKFELIGGTVFMASPLRRTHARYHVELGFALAVYENATPGIELLDNPTTILGEESEPQPDLVLRIESECGGRSRVTKDDYIEGPPELVVEIAHSTRAIDLHQKRADYRRAGVAEYLVLSIHPAELHWFDFRARRAIRPDPEGIYRSRVFPGLWLLAPAILKRERSQVAGAMRRGLAGPQHVAFVKRLAAKR